MFDLNMAMCCDRDSTSRSMRTAIGICAIFLLFLNTLPTRMEHSKLTQHAEIQIFRIQGKTMSEAHRELVQIHGQNALSLSTVRWWFQKFAAGVRDFSVKKTGGRLTKVNDKKLDEIRALLAEDNTMCLRVISRRTGLSLRTVHNVLRNKLELKKRPAKWIPHLLTQDQKDRRLRMAQDLLRHFRHAPTLQDRVVTSNECWFWCYEPATKRNSSTWLRRNERRPHKPVKDRYVRKVMVVIFWDSRGVIFRQFVPAGQGVTKEVYLQMMRDLREAIRRRRQRFWARQNFWLHHDGAPAHRSDIVVNFLQATGTNILPHPPYSPDLAPSDFFLFARLKKNMRGLTFNNMDELRARVDFEIGQVAHWEFAHAIRDSWVKRLEKCVAHRGNYFET